MSTLIILRDEFAIYSFYIIITCTRIWLYESSKVHILPSTDPIHHSFPFSERDINFYRLFVQRMIVRTLKFFVSFLIRKIGFPQRDILSPMNFFCNNYSNFLFNSDFFFFFLRHRIPLK